MTKPDTINQSRKPNKLINEKSPYLLQHAYNPVNWNPWGADAFAQAKAEDKPIFLLIGYSCCHWCHVYKRYYALIPSLFISKKEYKILKIHNLLYLFLYVRPAWA